MSRKITARFVWAVLSTLLEEAALVLIVLLGLPRLGVQLPQWGLIILLIGLMVAWGASAIIFYRKGSRALKLKPVVGLPGMIGGRGEVVSQLAPEGMVKIKGELWVAKSVSGRMDPGDEVIVVEQDRLKLIVRKSSASDLGKAE